jgi:Flp pilus assembly protein TadD
MDNGDSSGAEAAYRKGLEIFPAEPTLSNNLAVLFKEKGDVESALEIYEGGKNAEGYHNLGLIRAQEGVLGEAEAAYKEALKRDPTMVEVYYSLGGLYLLMDEVEKSAEIFEAFLKSGSDNATLVRRTNSRLLQLYPVLGDRHVRGGYFGAAERAYNRIVDLGGGTAGVYGNLAKIYGRRGEKARALSACRKSIELDPDFAKAYFTLASLLDEAGSGQGARKSYQDFLDRWQKDDRFAKRARVRISALKASP